LQVRGRLRRALADAGRHLFPIGHGFRGSPKLALAVERDLNASQTTPAAAVTLA
jgi:hypothetical protein